MYNCNGVLVSELNQADQDTLHSFTSTFSLYETVRLHQGQVLFWETHYFRIIASLRRYRFGIPMHYNMEVLKEELLKLHAQQNPTTENALFQFHFFSTKGNTQFIISSKEANPIGLQTQTYSVDLYKEAFITSGNLSNLSSTHRGLRIMAARYAEENGLEDVVFLNERKHLVETLKGTLYLVQNNQLRTPKLEAGCQDFALRTAFHHWLENEQTSYDLIEEDLNPFALQQSEALFVLSLEQGFQTISDYRKTQYSQEKISLLFTAFAASLD